MRSALTTAVELLGLASVCVGCWLLLPALAFIVAGVGLIAIGVIQA